MKKNKELFFKYLLIILAFILLLYYFWFRFFRERLPRNIPFILTPFSFLVIIILCIIYIFLLYKVYILHNKDKSNNYYFHLFFIKFQPLLKPFVFLHNFFILELNFIKIYNKYIPIIIEKFVLYEETNNLNCLLLFDFYPKILILCFFILDIIYFKTLNIFYYSLILGIIPLIYNYCVIISATALEILIQNLEKYYYIEILSTDEEEKTYGEETGLPLFMCFLNDLKYNDDGYLDLRYFVELQAYNLLFEYHLYKYVDVEKDFAKELYVKDHNFVSTSNNKENIEKAVYLQAFFKCYKDIAKPAMMKKHLIILLIGYLIGWLYILLISLHTLNLLEVLTILNTIKDLEEPFSGLGLNLYE